MAFTESNVGKSTRAKRYKFKHDLRRGVDVFLHVEPVSAEARDEMNKRFADRKRDKTTGNYVYFIPPAKDVAANKFLAKQCWTDIENGWVRLGTDEAVEFYQKELGDRFEKGDEVKLDGRLTDAIKDDIIDMPLANWITRRATDAEEETAEQDQENLEKNSQSSSSGSSETTERSQIRSVGSAS